MRKIKLYTLAIIDGLILVAATVAAALGFIYSVSISAEYLLLILAPAPAVWAHIKLSRICDRLNGLM